MLKINNLQKKIIKISTVISLVMISSFFLINKVSAATGYNIEQKTTEDNITYYHPTGYEDVYLFKGEGKYVLIYGNSSSSISVASNGKLTDDNSNNVLYISFSSEQEAYKFIFNNTAGAAVFEVYNACYVYQNITYSKIFTNNFDNNSGGDSSIISKTFNSYYSDNKIEIVDLTDIVSQYSDKKYWAIFTSTLFYENYDFLVFSDTPIEILSSQISGYNTYLVGSNMEEYKADNGSFDFVESDTILYSSSGTVANNFNGKHNTSDYTKFVIHYSNHDIYWKDTSVYFANALYFRSNQSGSTVVDKTYEFNEDIDVTDISKIKINFELPEDTRNLEVDIKWTFDNYSSNSSGYITTPYLEFKHSNGDISLSQDIFNLNGGDWFSDDYIATLLPDSDITEISLIVDTVKASGLLKVNFSSKFPYSISYEYTEEIEDYFITIDMDDYASISLIPKVYNIETSVSSSISSPIYKYGIYDVEIWEDLETKKVIDRWDNHSTSQFIYPMYLGYKNCVIHFIKKEVDASERYIKFDSRYYSYVVKKYLNEEVTIINPNTNENITIPDTSDLYKYDSPVDKRFSFNSFLKPIKFVFESITDFYNNYCPETVQYFFYLIFAFFVILVLIKIFL